MHQSLQCLVILLVLCFGLSYGQQQLSVFVAVEGGSDVTGDGTLTSPYQTISAAQNYIQNNITKENYSGNDQFGQKRSDFYFQFHDIWFNIAKISV